MKTLLITAVPEVATYAMAAGVERLFVDMEVLGKAERQGHLNTHKASHTPDDIACLRSVLPDAEIMVRTNPLHVGTSSEVDAAIRNGASRLMLPMFRTPEAVFDFIRCVDGRVPVTLLAETPQALVRLECYAGALKAGDEVYFGLNDLSLGLGLDYLFEPLAAGLLDRPAELLHRLKVPFGFGGIARVGEGELPAEWVMGEHVRLGSNLVILSRAFHGGAHSAADLKRMDFASQLARLYAVEREYQQGDSAILEQNRRRLVARTFEIAQRKRDHG